MESQNTRLIGKLCADISQEAEEIRYDESPEGTIERWHRMELWIESLAEPMELLRLEIQAETEAEAGKAEEKDMTGATPGDR